MTSASPPTRTPSSADRAGPLVLLRAMRAHQWAKNLLLAVPMFVGQRLEDPQRWIMLGLAFIAFSFAASAVYLLNDVLDITADREHPTKRHRPIASGQLSSGGAMAIALVLLITAALLAGFTLRPAFPGVLLAYLIATTAYSLVLKRVPMLDVLVLAGLYTLRLIAGGVATDVFPSFWLLAFSMFLFLSLAFGKRCSELLVLKTVDTAALHARGYGHDDLPMIEAMGIASGYLAVLVFSLYIASDAVNVLYARPPVLWLACPLLLYWISRFWLYVHRGRMNSDPVVFAVTDRVTWLTVALVAATIVAAAWPGHLG